MEIEVGELFKIIGEQHVELIALRRQVTEQQSLAKAEGARELKPLSDGTLEQMNRIFA